MTPFSLPRLETDVGIVKVEGHFDPVNGHIDVDELAHLDGDGWADVSHWLTEQAYENKIATIVVAIRSSLIWPNA
ncbi:hypothetical protein [Salinivibrio sharmensis]|uniref:Uncharacterized protein n=1 Tax=Salinivibrio sharmensis TaxID=390883 RepID=A0ABX3KBX9_9GAMM|nr:hypothetical protein [Salinivibrio sharmensis]OOE86254.1 hypothetical protein BZG74_12925 [Salinivibrio sharmensis]